MFQRIKSNRKWHHVLKQEICANAHETRKSLQQFRSSSLAKNWGVRT